MRARNLAVVALASIAALASAAPAPALAASSEVTESTSSNWSGYVASGSPSGEFSSASGSWVEPSTDCTSSRGAAAFWVGLGGTAQGSGALEQVGTEVDCSTGGAQHFSWYELVPAGPVRLDVPISAGDRVSARVSVSGTTVTVSLSNDTTGASTTKSLQMDNPDASSADWIAEAPSLCRGADASDMSSCTPVSLPDFGTVSFTGASATADGTTDTISSSNWSEQAMQLGGSGAGGATPSSLSPDGSSFAVAWQSDVTDSATASGDAGGPGSAYGPPGDYGYGGDPGAPGDAYGGYVY